MKAIRSALKQHLNIPIIGRQRPTTTEGNGMSFAPVFEITWPADLGGNPAHDGEILPFNTASKIGRWTEGVLLPK
jgi:hypothetical protein